MRNQGYMHLFPAIFYRYKMEEEEGVAMVTEDGNHPLDSMFQPSVNQQSKSDSTNPIVCFNSVSQHGQSLLGEDMAKTASTTPSYTSPYTQQISLQEYERQSLHYTQEALSSLRESIDYKKFTMKCHRCACVYILKLV